MHPIDDARSAEALVKNVYELIRRSPVWEKSLLLITFDEHGGFFDHVKPPKAVPPSDIPTEVTKHNFRFDQLGVRVPALVISPWIKRNVIVHKVLDHSSVLATVERLFGLPALTARDGAANDLLDVLSEIRPREDTPITLPSPIAVPAEEVAEIRLAETNASSDSPVVGKYIQQKLLIAHRRHLRITPANERDAISTQFAGIQTATQALDYLQQVSTLVKARKVPG
jgi:phospholipase C